MLTATELRRVLYYDPETGAFDWLVSRQGVHISRHAGSRPNAQGYIQICIDYKIYLAHRLAWLYMTGNWPPHTIDHVNRVRTDNRWVNLRAATGSQNNANAKVHRHNTSGFKGVYFDTRLQKYVAQVRWEGKNHYAGCFDTPQAAAKARRAKAEELHGQFVRDQ